MIRFSANLGFLFADRPLLDRIEAAAAAGFRAVEMHWPYDLPAEQVRAALDRAGMQMLGINAPRGDASRGENGLAALAGREPEFTASFAEALSYAVTLRATAIHCLAGVAKGPDAEQTYLGNLASAARKAGAVGKELLIEPLNSRDAPGYFLSTIEQAVAVIEKLGIGNLRILFDCYHVQIMGGDVIAKFAKYREFIGHVQIAAVPSRAEPDEGELAYPQILRAFDRLGYDGWIGAEYRPRTTTEAGLGWLEDYREDQSGC